MINKHTRERATFVAAMTAVAVILHLAIVSPDYSRKTWKHWTDEDGDCMNTRHEVLFRDSAEGTAKFSEDGCKIVGGLWVGPYSGEILNNPKQVQIDHIIALKEAHVAGGSRWYPEKKKEFANDMDNLLATAGSTNQKKSAQPESRWLPSERSYLPTYFKKRLEIRTKYGLTMEAKECQAMLDQILQ